MSFRSNPLRTWRFQEPACRSEVLESVLSIANEIAREGAEGRRVGALFTIGRADDVLRHSRPLILDPLRGHPPHARHIDAADLRGTVKALAQLDGAFVVADDGTVTSACRYLDAPAVHLDVGMGYGSRHLAAAGISKLLHIPVVALSQTGVIRVFFDGGVVNEHLADGP